MSQILAQTIATKYNVSLQTVQALVTSLSTTNFFQAAFNIPELGGQGMWQPGMVMVGDMFRTDLKVLVDQLCTEIVQNRGGFSTTQTFSCWWPSILGRNPDMSGTQNEQSYAVFNVQRKIAVKTASGVHVYNITHSVQGISAQNGHLIITFNNGEIKMLSDLQQVNL